MPAFCAAYIAGTDANRTVKDELTAVITRHSARKRISVTDLINPRQAFFDRTHPEIQPSPERTQQMMAGTGFHEAFGRAVSTEEFVEQLVEFNEIVGKIDIYEELPVELKTTGSIPSDPVGWRPSHVEQLGMYCAMVDRPGGFLLYYKRSEWGQPPDLKAFDLEFADLPGITAEMVRRRDLFKEALDTGNPDRLPRCEWFDRHCDFSAFCGCARAAPLERMVGPGTVRARENPVLARRVMASIGTSTGPPRVTLGLNDLVFPRKAAFRRAGDGEEAEASPQERMSSLQRQGFAEALNDALWYGFPGDFKRIRVPFGSIRASIMQFRGIPTLLRTNRGAKEMVERKRLADEFPHYIDRLAFECAVADSPRGRLIVYYAVLREDKFMVYDLWFKDLPAIRAEMQRRLDLLERGAPPHDLPACQPAWMEKYCQFASTGCRCAEG
ncbi:MAG: hypothetical protein HY334_08770 [Armatimonadetes bacterium]|nr:hypothetical protein [Armatimonadota bacterium]